MEDFMSSKIIVPFSEKPTKEINAFFSMNAVFVFLKETSAP